MPPNDYSVSHPPYLHYDEAGNVISDAPPSAPSGPRFSRGALDSVGQKIYDQLASQKSQLEQSLGPQEAAKYYTNLSGLTPDESLAMMASELRDTGITDIYKVKRETQQIPVRRDAGSGPGAEGGWESWDNYYDPQGNYVDPNTVKTDASGNYYLEKPQYVNTETGQPLVRSVGFGELAGRDELLSDMAVGKRQLTGTGVKFLDDGTPFYFSEGIQVPSGGFFKKLLSSPIGSLLASTALTTLLGPAGAGLSKIAAASVAGGLTGLVRSDGDIGDALKGAALGGLTSYGLDQLAAPSFDITDVVPADAWFTGTPELVDELFTGNAGGGAAPTFDPSLASPDIVEELFGASSGIESFPVGEVPSDLPIDFGPAEPSSLAPDTTGIEQILADTTPPGAGGDLGYALNEVNQPFTPEAPEIPELGADYFPEGSVPPDMLPGGPELDPTLGDPTAAPGGMPTEAAPQPEFDITDVVPPDADPTLGDPTAAPGGMPPLSVGDQLAIAGMTAGATLAEFAATPLGRLAMALGGSALVNKLFNEQQGAGAGAGTAGWSGTIPTYQRVRERVPLADTERRPGEYGRRYFSDTAFVPITPRAENAEANLAAVLQAQQAAQAQAAGLASLPPGVAERRAKPAPTVKYQEGPTPATTTTATSPAGLPAIPTYTQEPRLSYGLPTPDERLEATNLRTPEERRLRLTDSRSAPPPVINLPAQATYPRQFVGPPVPSGPAPDTATPFTVEDFILFPAEPVRAAQGGLMGLTKGRYLNGSTDGMEDRLKATIEDKQPARLSHGEFVIPADVVSHLGNGNSQAGAKRLYDMMDKIRHARTGTKKQGKQINPSKYLPS